MTNEQSVINNRVGIVVSAVHIPADIGLEFIRNHAERVDTIEVVGARQFPRGRQFSPALAANIGVRSLLDSHTVDVIVKTDIDCLLDDQFLQRARLLTPGRIIAPFILFETRSGLVERDMNPCGTVAAHVDDWAALNGYDERMYGHGAEDWEMLDRAMARGISVVRTMTGVRHKYHPTRIDAEWYPRRRRENLDIRDKQPPYQNPNWGKVDTP